MSSARTFFHNFDSALRNNFANVSDPGDAGTIDIGPKALGICEVVTAGAETRVLADPDTFGLSIGSRCIVILKKDGGDLTISSSEDSDVVLDAEGEFAEFIVTVINDNTKQWRVVSNHQQVETEAAITPADAGTYEFLATPSAEDNLAGLLTILAALETAGLIDDSGITQAT